MADPVFGPAGSNAIGLSDAGTYTAAIFADIDGDGDLDAFVGNLLGITLYFQNTGSAGSAVFASSVTNPLGLSDVGNSAKPSFADIDGDGDLDAFVGNYSGNVLYFRNTGSASSAAFASSLTNPFGLSDVGGSSAPTFADVDFDGDLDAFVGNGDGNTLYFQNTGSASSAAFAAALTNPFGLSDVGYFAAPTFADIDIDGDLDAFVGNSAGNILYFQNTGSASSAAFASSLTNPYGLSAVGGYATPTFADIDGDGDLDALVGSFDGNTLVFLNRTPEILLTQSAGASAAVEGGATDSFTVVLDEAPTSDVVITLDDTNGQVSLSAGTLTFTSANWNIAQTVTVTALNDSVGEGAHTGVVKFSVVSADATYNGTALAPVIVGVKDNDLPAGAPLFGLAGSNLFGLSAVVDYASPTLADIDGDGDLDAFVGAYNGDIRYFQNTGNASSAAFASALSNPFGLGNVGTYASLALADIDGDGDLDAFLGEYFGNIFYFQNTGSASSAAFSLAVSNPFGLSDVGYIAAPSFADIDADGDLDAFVGESNGNTLYLQNTGSVSIAAFAPSLTNPFGLSDVGIYANPNLADIDGDGDLDVFVGDADGNTLYWSNTGSASSPAFYSSLTNPFGLADVGAFANPTFADIDGDGDLDAFVGNSAGNTLYFQNTGSASNAAFASTVSNPFGLSDVGNSAKPSFADIDADGDLDAFVGNILGITLYFQNTGSASNAAFASAVSNPFGLSDVGGFANPTFADIDGDGDLDAFVGNYDLGTLYFQNSGSASSAAFTLAAINPFGLSDVGNSAKPRFADIDADGDLDAFIGNSAGNILYYQNTGSLSSAAFASALINPFGLSNVGFYATPTLADIDGDGDLDAFIGDINGNATYFKNTGNASNAAFGSALINPFGLSDVGFYAAPMLADIDADGDLDAFMGNSFGNTLVYLNRTPKILVTQSAGTSAVVEGGATDSFMVVLDEAPTFDVVITLDDTNGQVLLSASALTFTSANWLTAQTVTVTARNDSVGEGAHTGAVKFSVASADAGYNGMALAPVFVAVADNDLPAGAPTFGPAVSNPYGLSDVGGYAAPTFADIDGDGDLDAFVGNIGGNTLYFQNTGSASSAAFASALTNPFGLSDVGFFASPTLADIDGDGDLDAFVGNGDGNTLYFQNTGSASSAAFALAVSNPFGLSDVGYNAKPSFADIDGDVDLDAFVSTGGNTLYFQNTGSASSAAFASSLTNPFGLSNVGAMVSPTLVDIDGDGDLDAFVGTYVGGRFYFQNTGSASSAAFASALVNPFGLSNSGSASRPNFADIDGDGDLDAFVGTKYGNTYVSLNDQASALATPAAISFTDTRFDDSFANANRTLSATDVDSISLSYGIQGGIDGGSNVSLVGTYGTLTVTKATGEVLFTPEDAAIEALGSNTSENFSVTASDGISTVSKTLVINLNQSGTTETTGADSLSGTGGDDTFDGLDGNDTLSGDGGADSILGGLGLDSLVGGLGNDTLRGGNQADTLLGGDGSDYLEGGKGLDSMDGGIGDDQLFGQVGNDTLIGFDGFDSLDGGDGNDSLNGGTGSDSMKGGLGNDSYIVDIADDIVTESSDSISGGIDTVNSSVTRTLGSFQEMLILTGTTAIHGTGNTLANTITGNSGANSLSGSSGNDTLLGDAGNDTLNGGTGTDSMNGGLGDDTYSVDNALDIVTESSVTGTGGIDTISSSVTRTLGNFQEKLILTGTTAIHGTGNTLANTLTGNSGANSLSGSSSNDTLIGNGGADTLTGGAGKDSLTGGLGADRFDFNLATESAITTSRDVITDFVAGQGDKIDLAGIDANTAVTGNQPFTNLVSSASTFSATTSFTGASAGPGQLYYDQTAKVLYGNVDADAAAEFSVALTGVVSLSLTTHLIA